MIKLIPCKWLVHDRLQMSVDHVRCHVRAYRGRWSALLVMIHG